MIFVRVCLKTYNFSRLKKEQKQNAFNQFEDLRIVLATLINVHWTLKKEKELEEVSSFNN